MVAKVKKKEKEERESAEKTADWEFGSTEEELREVEEEELVLESDWEEKEE